MKRTKSTSAPCNWTLSSAASTCGTNPGDIVLDPFAGIGSVPYQAVLMGRRGLGIELKDSYYAQAVKNLEARPVRPTAMKSTPMCACAAPCAASRLTAKSARCAVRI